MSNNAKKSAQTVSLIDLQDAPKSVENTIKADESQVKGQSNSTLNNDELKEGLKGPNADLVANAIEGKGVLESLLSQMQQDPNIGPNSPAGQMLLIDPKIRPILDAVQKENLPFLDDAIEQLKAQGLTQELKVTNDTSIKANQLITELRRLRSEIMANQAKKQIRPFAFNLKKYKIAQAISAQPTLPDQSVGQFFPVKNLGDLIDKIITNFSSPEMFSEISNYIINEISGPTDGTELSDILKQLQVAVGENDNDSIVENCKYLYSKLPPKMVSSSETNMDNENVVANNDANQNPKGIYKYNLSQFVLNNKNITKEASTQGLNDSYLLYGPGDNRICPKLVGRGGGKKGGSDVVSEYICRFHCADGIVIDDAHTVCGEALWRANVMDKFNRPYKNADGEWVGGYIEGRFEVNRTPVDEENRMQLKPGETRKPRPASQGNLESRMQEMRNKQGEARGYRPDTDTSKPFEWCHDVDQNNVEVDQDERVRREEDSGHVHVKYTNRDQGENNPKVQAGFNLKQYKTAQALPPKKEEIKNTEQNDETKEETELGKNVDVKAFNLRKHKLAQMTGINGPVGPDYPASDDIGHEFGTEEDSELMHHSMALEIPLFQGDYDKLTTPEKEAELQNLLNTNFGGKIEVQMMDSKEIVFVFKGDLEDFKQNSSHYRLKLEDIVSDVVGAVEQPENNTFNDENPIIASFNMMKYKTAGTKEPYDFRTKEQQYRNYSNEQLEFAFKDADEAVKAIGRENPDQGWYLDDVHTIRDEITRREKLGEWTLSPSMNLVNNSHTYDTNLTYKSTGITPNKFNLSSYKKQIKTSAMEELFEDTKKKRIPNESIIQPLPPIFNPAPNSPCCDEDPADNPIDNNVLLIIRQHPVISKHFIEPDDMEDFLENLQQEEANDLHHCCKNGADEFTITQKIRVIQLDNEESAKDLCIDN